MNRTLMTVGAVVTLLAMSMNAQAYHFYCDAGAGCTGTNTATDPQSWEQKAGVNYIGPNDPTNFICLLVQGLDPTVGPILESILCFNAGNPTPSPCVRETVTGLCTGDNLFGVTACESQATVDTTNAVVKPEADGKGGLCNMSAGFSVVGGFCVAGGNANGAYDDYQTSGGSTSCVAAPAAANKVHDEAVFPSVMFPTHQWLTFTMQRDHASTGTNFDSQLNGLTCAVTPAAATTYIDAVYLYESGGELTGFPSQDVIPGALGTYTAGTVATVPAHTTANDCNGSAPWLEI